MKISKFLFTGVALLWAFAPSAFAVKFNAPELRWTAQAGQNFSVDLTTALTDIAAGQPVSWSVDALPKWLSFDDKTGVLSGTPTDANVGEETFSIFALQGSSADEVNVFVTVEGTPGQANAPTWLTDVVKIQGCTGKPIASPDFGNLVMLSNPGLEVPVPRPQFSTLQAPSWIVSVSKTDGSFYLTGIANQAGDYEFKTRACIKSDCSDVSTLVQIVDCH